MAISLEIESKNMTNFFRSDRRIISSDKFRVTLSAVKMLALSIIRKILETSPQPLWNLSGLVSNLLSEFNEKSTEGEERSHGGKEEREDS